MINFFFLKILEVAPTSASEVPPTTRLCAYWSQQYRCLYPGTAASSTTPESDPDPKYIVVEFDDGDSGRIAIEDIRLLLSEYPIVGECIAWFDVVCVDRYNLLDILALMSSYLVIM